MSRVQSDSNKKPNNSKSERTVLAPASQEITIDPAIDPAIDEAIDEAINPAIDPAIDEAINGSFDEATPETKYKLSILLKAIINDEGRRKPDYLKSTNIGSESTIKRYLDQLREVGFIEFKGTAPQTGGYFITEKFKL